MKTLDAYVTHIEDYPHEGIIFHDITTVMQDADGLALAIEEMKRLVDEKEIDAVCGIESRGFLFGVPLALSWHKPFIMARKKGKLPRETVEKSFSLEYGKATIELHKDSIKPGDRVLIVDDLIATGGTAQAVAALVEELGGVVAGFVFLVELTALEGRKALKDYSVASVLSFDR